MWFMLFGGGQGARIIFFVLFHWLSMYLHIFQKSLEEQNVQVLQTLRDLFKFSQSAVQIWDEHEDALAKLERSLVDKLDECRDAHNGENQVRPVCVFVLERQN